MSSAALQNEAAASTLTSNRKRKETTEAYLIRLTLSLLESWNEQRYDDILSADFLAPAFQMKRGFGKVEIEGNPPINLKSLVEHHQRLASENPARHAHAVDSTAVMDKHHFSGQVFMNVELTGVPPGVLYSGVMVSEWRWLHSKWLCVRQTCMRGAAMAPLDCAESNSFQSWMANPEWRLDDLPIRDKIEDDQCGAVPSLEYHKPSQSEPSQKHDFTFLRERRAKDACVPAGCNLLMQYMFDLHRLTALEDLAAHCRELAESMPQLFIALAWIEDPKRRGCRTLRHL